MNTKSRVEELSDRVQREGILGISGATFKDHQSPNGVYNYKANTTPAEYCAEMGVYYGVSAEQYADSLLNMMDAPSEKLVGECKKCFKLLTESEVDIHQCDGKGRTNLADLFAKK